MIRLILLAALFFTNVGIFAQNQISIPDTTLERARVYSIPVYIETDFQFDEIELVFTYDKNLLDIKGIDIDENSLASSIESFNLYDEGDINYFSSALQTKNSTESVLCYINLEALVGPDSVTNLEFTEVLIDGELSSDFSVNNSRISIIGEPVYPGNLETVSLNYPNPFYYETKIDLSLFDNSSIEIKLYNTIGKLIAEYPGDQNDVLKMIMRKDGIEIDNNFDPLVAGNYSIVLLPKNNRFSSGVYFLYLKTNSNIYKRNLIYEK